MNLITKPHAFLAIVALAFTTAARAEEKPEPFTVNSSTTSTAVAGVDASGTITVETIDENGHKQTKTINIGKDESGVIRLGGGGEGQVVVEATALELGPVTRLGVAVEPVSDELSANLPVGKGVGLVVRHVAPNSSAAKAGIEDNDVLVQIGDQILVHPKQLQTLVTNKKPGDKIEVTFFRKGEKKTAAATLEAGTPDAGAAEVPFNMHAIDLGNLLKGGLPGVNVQTKAVIIGPDGKQTVIEDEGSGADFGKGIDEQIQKTLKGLNGPAGDAVRKALQEAEKARQSAEKAAAQARGKASKAQGDVNAQLEMQKKAIEQMQQELEKLSEQLKQNAGKKDEK